MKKISLSQWFFKKTKLPLLVVGVSVALVQVGFVIYTHNKFVSDQAKSVKSLVKTIATIGIEQGNRPVLEASFQLAIEELGVESILACKGAQVVMQQPLNFGSCPNPPTTKSFQSVVEVVPSGFTDYKFYFYLSNLSITPALVIINSIIFLLLGIVFFTIYRIQRDLSKDVLAPLENDLSSDEDFEIRELNKIKKHIEDHTQSKEKQAVAGAILEHNLSIGHNIKSIQQTLDVIKSGEFSSERQKSRIEQLSTDIKAVMVKIADHTPDVDKVKLITSDETFYEYLEKENEKKTKVNVANAFEIAVENKNLELQNSKDKPAIKLSYKSVAKKSFIEVVGPELRAVLSNMMNNSIEAGAKNIEINLEIEDQILKVLVTDDGKGIKQEIQKDVFDRGFTDGKENGTGYGLYHGKRFIESWGGHFNLASSEEGKTVFELGFDLWKLPTIDIPSAKSVVLLDDEKGVHRKWKRLLEKENSEANFLAFKNQEEFTEWFDNHDDFSEHLFIFDSDLGPNTTTGEQLIDDLGIGSMAYLVTNNYNSPALTKWCQERSIEVIPKGVLC